jgi:hypothetical protein
MAREEHQQVSQERSQVHCTPDTGNAPEARLNQPFTELKIGAGHPSRTVGRFHSRTL